MCALNGIRITFKSERNFKIHIAVMVIAIVVGVYLDISLPAWGLVIFAIALVLVAELFNTAVERIGDELAHGKQSPAVKKMKDISAAAVLMAALAALAIGVIFLLVPFIQKMAALWQGN
jgi:diacylglycerol kinase